MKLLNNNSTFSESSAVYTDGRPYKVYTALLTQTEQNTPVSTVLENTIGDIVWSYEEVGTYFGTLTGAFTEGKVFCINNQFLGNFEGSDIFFQQLYPIGDQNKVIINTYIYTEGEWRKGDMLLVNTPIEIRVYP